MQGKAEDADGLSPVKDDNAAMRTLYLRTFARNSDDCYNCDRRRGSFCCADCGYKRSGNCKNPCLNGHMRCGQVVSEKDRMDDT